MTDIYDDYQWFEHPTLPAFFQMLPNTWSPPEEVSYFQDFTTSVGKAVTAWERIVERQVRAIYVSPRAKARQMAMLGFDKLYSDARHAFHQGEIYSGSWDGSGDYIFRNIEERTWL